MSKFNDVGYGVLVIYTGGTIGSVPKDRKDPLSPLEPAGMDEVMDYLPFYDKRDRKIKIGGKLLRLETVSWEEPIDSSNVTPDDWIEIAKIIKDNYKEFEGFVVIHGTDTLAYTASALSFMLDNLDKPVIITGSQRPIGETRSDAVQNLVTSIEIASAKSLGGDLIPEVCVFFRDNIYRGCRTTKVSASDFVAFESPNYFALGKADERIVVNTQLLRKVEPPPTQILQTATKLERNIASMDIFPGMNEKLLSNMLETENLKGVILQTFGSGNVPTRKEFLDVIAQSVEKGKVIVDITQCRSGEVELGLYDVSAGLLSRGVVSGTDMTPEAALTKLAVVLGQEDDVEIAGDKMQLNLRGEQRQSIFNLHFPPGQVDEKPIQIPSSREMVHGKDKYKPRKLNLAVFRLMGLEIPEAKRGTIEFKVYLDLPEANKNATEDSIHFLGYGTKYWEQGGEPQSVFFEVTEQVRGLVDNRHQNTITIVNVGANPFIWKKLNIAFFADC